MWPPLDSAWTRVKCAHMVVHFWENEADLWEDIQWQLFQSNRMETEFEKEINSSFQSLYWTSDLQHVHIPRFNDLYKEEHATFEFNLFLHFNQDRDVLVGGLNAVCHVPMQGMDNSWFTLWPIGDSWPEEERWWEGRGHITAPAPPSQGPGAHWSQQAAPPPQPLPLVWKWCTLGLSQ